MWTPLLSGAIAERAWRAIERIAGSLREARPAAVNLADGSAGFALLYAYLYEARERDEDLEAMSAHLERAVAELESVDSLRLLDGVTGIGWVLEHVAGEPDGPDLVAPIDQMVLEAAADWAGRFDLSMGLAGWGIYALERLGRDSGEAVAAAVAAKLIERLDDGWWPTPPEHVDASMRERAPDGYVNLGVAHGVFGPIGFLAALAARTGDIALLDIADRAVERVAAARLAADSPSRLPFVIPKGGGERTAARLGWCYGDAGASAALLAAADIADEPRWLELALDLADAAAAREPEGSGATGPGLCHGAAGVGHMLNRVGQRTGDARTLEAARRWLERALEMSIQTDDFMNGGAGVALALLAAVSEVEPEWDRVLLMSLEVPG